MKKASAPSILVAMMLLAVAVTAPAQQPTKIPRIGYVAGAGDSKSPGAHIEAFQQRLRDLGYVEGKNILIEYRHAEGKLDRVSSFVAELVQLNVDVLVCPSLVAIRAAQQATKTIPIVMVTAQDPVAIGLVASLARPGGNITGLTRLTRDLSGKRLELLTEVIPKMSRVGVLWDSNAPGPVLGFNEYQTAAAALNIKLLSLEVRGPDPDLERAFQTATTARASALVTIRNPVISHYLKRIAELATENRLPWMSDGSDSIEPGGLMSYSADEAESFRRAAVYVDKILKGAKPADLPIERPTKFELVINLKTAKQIGLTIPANVLARADKVIK
jgi:ABC-type uncharacterized transport system substrate-binding protein